MNRLRLFGGALLHTAAGPVTGRAAQRHRMALLALLAATRRSSRSREQLATLLWPDADGERGRKLLSDSIYRINQALGCDAITGCGDDVRLNPNQVGSDIADFEAAVDAREWMRAADLFAGPFLDGFFLPGSAEFDQWMELERARLARVVGKAIEELATAASNAGRVAESVDLWQRLASLAPDDSRIALELMRALEASGNRAGAIRHARSHSRYLRETLGVEPDPPVRELAETSIAVLPFADVSASTINTCFADELSEELMFRLTRAPGVRVASPTSAFACRDLKLDVREVARRLSVDWILEGSVRRSGHRLRIVAQLTDPRNGYQIWSASFDRASKDGFAIQKEVAASIANRVAPALTSAARTPVAR